MPQFIKTRWFRISAVLALLVALYALAGFWLAPKLVRNAITKDIPASLGLTPTVGNIRINPFLFQVEVTDFALADASGEKLVGFKRFFVDFELSSLWHRAYSFGNIDIAQPFLNAVVAKNGDLNLLALKGKPSAQPPAKPGEGQSQIPPLWIRDFNVSDGRVSYDDRSTPSGFSARLEPLNFDLKDFTTGVDGGRFTFSAASNEGERFEWHGHLSVQPIESDGEFQLDGLKARTIWDYLEDKLNFVVNSGKLNLNAKYRFALKDTPDLDLDVQKVALTDLTVRPKGGDADWVSLPELLVSDTHVALAPKKIEVGAIRLTGLKLSAWLNPDGSINLMQLAQAPGAAAAPPVKSPPAEAAASAPATNNVPWSLSLHALELKGAEIQAEDRTSKPVTRIAVAPLELKVEDASLDLAKPVKVMLDATLNGGGKLSLSGPVTPQPLAAQLAVKMADIDLSVAQPYIAQYTSMTLKSGLLSGETKVVYGSGKPQLAVVGAISVAKLHTIDNALHQDFINWDQLQLQGVDFQHGPDRLNIDQVLAQKLYARVIIEPDTSLNVKRVLAGPNATVVVPGTPGTTAKPVTATAAAPPPPSPKSRRPRKGGPPAPAAQPAASASMPILVKSVIVQASEADFADLTVQPNFSAGIQNLQGTVSNISSRTGSRAKIDLKGQVDPFAPVAIIGEANFLSPVLFTDIAMSFRNVELSTFNPYSGKFAGYNIAKGKLTTEMHYKVDGRKLDATHHIVVDQLEFGDKTESKEAVSLPIKLAVALLKDKNGVIDLDLPPITGTLDDPQFKVGPMIWTVVTRIIVDAVAAPFRLLGRLFGGGPDLKYIDFEPGAPDLDAAGADKARAIAKALNERPQLKIEVPIAALKDIDGTQLIEAHLKAQITDAQALKKKGALPFDQLDAAAKVDVLALVYQSAFGTEPKYPDDVTSIKTKPDQLQAKIDYLTKQARGHITVSEADLTSLGQQRAANVQKALLTDTQIDPERVFLVANDKAKVENGKVRLELSLR